MNELPDLYSPSYTNDTLVDSVVSQFLCRHCYRHKRYHVYDAPSGRWKCLFEATTFELMSTREWAALDRSIYATKCDLEDFPLVRE